MPNIISNFLQDWYSPTNPCSPDCYNTCSIVFPVPSPTFGYQNPKSGNGFVGIYIEQYDPQPITNQREYIQAKLKDTLKQGVKYCASFYVNVPNRIKYTSSSVGAYVGGPITAPGFCTGLVSYVPQLANPNGNFITDTASWTLVNSTFVAQGGEQYITLGNFNPTNSTDTMTFNPTSNVMGVLVYFYIDEVSLVELSVEAGRDTSICIGQSVTLGEVQNDTSFHSYYWYSNGVLIDSLTNFITVNPSATTTYVLEKRLCESVYDTVVVIVKHPFSADIIQNNIELCLNNNIQLPTINTIGSTQWNWLPNIAINNAAVMQPIVSPTTNISYTVVANMANPELYCNTTFRDSVNVIINQHIPVQILSVDTIICNNASLQIITSAASGDFIWLPGWAVNDSTVYQPYFNTSLINGTVNITVTKHDTCGISTDTLQVRVINCDTLNGEIIVPNIFTPNGDGKNDVFEILLLDDFVIDDFEIFNRWGNLVYEVENKNAKKIMWDGRSTSGEPCSDGVYYFILKYKNSKGETISIKSFISLIR
jgi:gliding motility-associated-like protein